MLYFAYGSNMQTATLRGRRGIEYTQAFAAHLRGWRLVFDKPPLLPIGESFANLVPDAGSQVMGVAYEVTEEDLLHLDVTEGVALGSYRRIEIEIAALLAPQERRLAQTLVSEQRDPTMLPSRRYMACLVAGAQEHGLPAEYVALLRAVPARPETAEARRARPLVERFLRRRG